MTDTTPKKDVEKRSKQAILSDLYKKLSIPIDEQFLVKYQQDGKEFIGYHAQYAIDLLNEIVGLGNWHTVFNVRKEEVIGKGWVVAGDLTILIEYKGHEFAVNGLGGSYAKDIANAYKGFKTSAFKNACRYLGIGKELYVKGFEDDIIMEEATVVPIIENNELANKIEQAKTIEELDSLKDTIKATEGKAVKDVLVKKYNDKKISLMEK